MALTLNNLVSKLEEFVTNHEILNSWYFNDPWYGLKDGESIQYPMMFGRLKPSRLGINTDFTTFEIFVCDRVKKDKLNETEAASNTKSLAKDLLSYLKQTQWTEFLNVKTDVTLEHFFESFDDEVTGCKFDLEIKTAFEWDLCSVPITGAPSQPNYGNVTIVDQDGNTIATLTYGQSYTVEVLSQIIQTLNTPSVTIIQTLT